MSYDLASLSFLKRRWLLSESNIPHRFLGLDPKDVEKRIGNFAPEIEDWIEDVLHGKVIKNVGGLGTTGVGLLFDGDPGLGKTTHAVLALTELVRLLPDNEVESRELLKYRAEDYGIKARPIYYMTVPDFITRKKAMIDADPDQRREMNYVMEGFHGRAKMDHLNVRVLVLDDLGKELSSDYNVAGFDELLRSRYDKGLPTIVTTNLTREQWGRKYGEAMGSFVYEAFNRVIIGSKDLRRTK
jgi:DNA replication protein DnaC